MKGTIGFLISALFALFLALKSAKADAGPAPAMPERWRALLTELVRVSSGTGNPEGLERVRELLLPEFRELGLETRVIEAGGGRRVLVAETAGPDHELLLVGHVDTVFEAGGAFQDVEIEGDRMTGPGVIDMKGGIVLMLQVLSELKAEGLLRGIRVVLNDDEETGSGESRDELQELARGIPYGLVFEPGLADGSVVTAHSGVRWLKLTVEGRAAHAGLEPEMGVNACVEAAHKGARIAAITDLERGLSVNLGVMRGGSKPNVVCESAELVFDLRYRRGADLEEALGRIRAATEEMTVFNPVLGLHPTARLETLAQLPSMPPESTRELYALAAETAASLGQQVPGRPVGYASDGNHLAATGIRLLVGVGPYGGGMHTRQEFLSFRGYAERVRFNRLLIRNLLKKGN